MSAAVYTQFGMRFRSSLPLRLPSIEADSWDIDVREGPPCEDSTAMPPGKVIATFEDEAGRHLYVGTEVEDGYLLRFSTLGEFAISSDLRVVEARRDPQGDDILPILMSGTVTAFILCLAGHCVLHASAVALDGRAIAFVGHSGRGKSTMAALMCAAGAELVTDDVLRVDPGPPAVCYGGAPEVRLREGAHTIADGFGGAAARRTTMDERLALAPPRQHPGPVPLGAIILPSPNRRVPDLEILPMSATDAAFMMLSFPRIEGWDKPEVIAEQFEGAAELATQVPIYHAVVPWGPPFSPRIPEVIAGLLDDQVRQGLVLP